MTGVWVHVVLATVGLSALLLASAEAFTAVKWIGGGYLVWLGIKALRSKGSGSGAAGAAGPACNLRRVYGQGVLVSALNPKVAVFFLAFLPQFVVPGAGPVSAQLLLHGVLVVAVAAVIEPWIVLAAARAADAFQRNPRIGLWLDRTLARILHGYAR